MTHRLINLAAENWPRLDGWLASQGQDLMDFPIDRFLSVVYYWATRYADEKESQKFDTRLWMPPVGSKVVARGPWSAEAETAAFKSLAAAIKGKGPDSPGGGSKIVGGAPGPAQ